MVDRHYLEWYSPYGDQPIRFDSGGLPYLLNSFSGFSSNNSEPAKSSAPMQMGATLLNNLVSTRILSAVVTVDAEDYETYWERRQRLASVLAMHTTEMGQEPLQGLLRFYRPGKPMMQIRAVPRNSPQENRRVGRYGIAYDIEWEADQPFWEEMNSRIVDFSQGAGGFQFPLEHPWESLSRNRLVSVSNPGQVPSPVFIRFYGQGTTSRLVNENTGDLIEIEGEIASDEVIEVDTSFGSKKVTLIRADGTRENAMSRVNFDVSKFWHLGKGTTEVFFEMVDNISGWATLTYRPRYGGL